MEMSNPIPCDNYFFVQDEGEGDFNGVIDAWIFLSLFVYGVACQ